jgi:hypothetical protein
MQILHEIFQSRVESKVDGFIQIADKDNLVQLIFTITGHMTGRFYYILGYRLRFEPGTNLAAGRRANQGATPCILSDTFSNVAAHLCQEGTTMSLDLLGPAISLGFHPALH